MKQNIQILLACAALLSYGCASFESVAGKSLASVAISVDGTMRGWSVWVVAGKANPEQEAKVREAYNKYQLSMDIAKNAYITAATTKDTKVYDVAFQILEQNKNSLINLITIFQGLKN